MDAATIAWMDGCAAFAAGKPRKAPRSTRRIRREYDWLCGWEYAHAQVIRRKNSSSKEPT